MAHTLKTSTSKGTARIVGALFLTAMVASLVGAGLLESPMTAADYLSQLTAASGQVKIGVLLELINGVAVIWIALLMFPIFKQHAESSALGYVAFRLVEAMVIFAAALTPVILLTMGEGSSVGGDVLVVVRKHLVGEVTGIFFSIAAFIFYCLLYQMKLVPIWLSVWGLIAVVLIFVWNLLELVGISISVGIVFGLPIILNEVVLGIWLIIKGFESAEELPVQE